MRAIAQLLVLVAVVSAGSAGCKGPAHNPHDAGARLSDLVERWREIRGNGWSCEERAPTETPIVDCQRVRRELEGLALEFPRNVPVLLANAVVSFQAKQFARSQMHLDALFELEPVQPDAAVLRTRLAVREGNLRFARRFIDEQIELTPDHSELREARAAVRYLARDLAGAARDLETARSLGAPEARVVYHQGLVAEAAGRLEEAERHYRRAAALQSGPSQAASRLRALRLGADPGPR